jgi:hypothetical protein
VNGAQANKLFLDGVAAKTKGDIREACASFEASQELDSNPATRVYMAWCLEQEGHKATAWGLYQRFVAEMSNKPDSNAEAKRLREFAIREMDRIQPSLSYLTIKVPAESEIDGLEVRCGSEVISAGTWNHALPMDAGTYEITAWAPNKVSWTTVVTIGSDADNAAVEIPRLGPLPPRRSLQLALAVGGASLGAAAGFYLLGLSSYHDAENEMVNQARRDSLVKDANAQRHIALGMGIVGLACGGVAAWQYVTHRHAETSTAPNRARAHIVLSLGGGSGTGLMVLGSF